MFAILDREIPKVSIDNTHQPPWFDSELFNACRLKEKLRSKYKKSGSIDSMARYVEARREFKKLAESKMRQNLINDEDTCMISKKCWSYVKSKSNNTRIP